MMRTLSCTDGSRTRLPFAAIGYSLLILSMAATASTALQAQQACEKLKDLHLPDTAVVSAESVPAGPFALPPGLPAKSVDMPAFCRVQGELKPTPDSLIKFEVWMPAQWNGKFEQQGNGGLAGSINQFSLAKDMKSGYATAATDDGHQGIPVEQIVGPWTSRKAKGLRVSSGPRHQRDGEKNHHRVLSEAAKIFLLQRLLGGRPRSFDGGPALS